MNQQEELARNAEARKLALLPVIMELQGIRIMLQEIRDKLDEAVTKT